MNLFEKICNWIIEQPFKWGCTLGVSHKELENLVWTYKCLKRNPEAFKKWKEIEKSCGCK